MAWSPLRSRQVAADSQVAWDRVRCWDPKHKPKGLRRVTGEAKLAWLTLWQLAGGRPGLVTITTQALAADQGTSPAAGRRQLVALADLRLVVVRDHDEQTGVYLVELREPAEVITGHLVHTPDAQLALPLDEYPPAADPDEADTPSATLSFGSSRSQGRRHGDPREAGTTPATHSRGPAPGGRGTRLPAPPAARTSAEPLAVPTTEPYAVPQTEPPTPDSDSKERSYPDSDSDALGSTRPDGVREESESRVVRGGSANGSAAALRALVDARRAERREAPEPPALADVVAGRLAAVGQRQSLAGQAARLEAVDRLAGEVLGRVPGLRPESAERIAAAVVDGELDLLELRRLYASLGRAQAQGLRSTAAQYFASAAKRRFRELGLTWSGGPS